MSGLEGRDNENIERDTRNYPSGEEKFVLMKFLDQNSHKIPVINTVLFWFPTAPLPQIRRRTLPSKSLPIKQTLNKNDAKTSEWSNHAVGIG